MSNLSSVTPKNMGSSSRKSSVSNISKPGSVRSSPAKSTASEGPGARIIESTPAGQVVGNYLKKLENEISWTPTTCHISCCLLSVVKMLIQSFGNENLHGLEKLNLKCNPLQFLRYSSKH